MAGRGPRGNNSGKAILCFLVAVIGAAPVPAGLAQTSAGSWSTVTFMPTPRFLLAAVTGPVGKIYTLGGVREDGNVGTSIVEAYDPASNKWTCSVGDGAGRCSARRIAPVPTQRLGLAATALDGKIYVIGGCSTAGCPSTIVEAYNPSTNTWTCSIGDPSPGCSSTSIAPMPTARDDLATVTGADGRIYAIGGAATRYVSTVEAYDPATNTWACSIEDLLPGCSSTNIAPMPAARGGLAGALGPDGRIYAIGGSDNNTIPSSAVVAYTPSTNTWSAIAPMSSARYVLAAASSDGRVYALGGCTPTGCGPPTASVEAYDPAAGVWTAVAPMPAPRYNFAAATGSDGRIYALGTGEVASRENLDVVVAYSPAISPAAASTPSPTAASTAATAPTPAPTATALPTPAPTDTATSRVAAVPAVSPVAGESGVVAASFTVSFWSTQPGQGEIYFGPGPGCLGLVEVATHDLHPGSTQHTVVVTGNDLPGTVGDNGITPGTTYWYETVTLTGSGKEIDNNGGKCYSVTIPRE